MIAIFVISDRFFFSIGLRQRKSTLIKVCYCGDIPFTISGDRLYISLLIKLWEDAIAQEKLLFRHQDMLQCGIFQLTKWQ
ncbi:hypothetical protein [Microcystis aeruginosa]|uniref:hypothetical protein n=1 Tax=Microcystis aeruginosa TaxID=1126 RepID=UPI0011BFC8BA|nr:hypothetical protein [Microcystis aeruginosa]